MRGSILSCLLPILALVACDSGDWLRFRGIRSFRVVSAADARRLAAEPHAWLLQVPDATNDRMPGARLVDAQEPLPEELTEGSGTVVVLAAETGEGYRLAARLARAGIPTVAVVEGGVEAWQMTAAQIHETAKGERDG